MDYQTFRTRAEAREHLRNLRGWDARVVQLHAVGWVIECRELSASRDSQPLYLRDDGYVR